LSDVPELRRAFKRGTLVNPRGVGPDLVDLARALHALGGATGCKLSRNAHALCDLISATQHYVFVVLDGLGREVFARAPEGGFFHGHLAGELRSVFPSTTAAALTSLATGEYPARHAVTAWWVWLNPPGVMAEVLPFVERFGRKSLSELGIRAEDVFTVPSAISRLTHTPLSIIPADLAGSVYSLYSAGHTKFAGYKELGEAFDIAVGHVSEAHMPTFTYVYVPHLDAACHSHGVGSIETLRAVTVLDDMLDAVAARLSGRARLVVTGDHGLVDVPDERRMYLDEGDPLLDHLLCPPSGEPTTLYFHVKPGREEAFRGDFVTRLGEYFALITRSEADSLHLFGPDPLNNLASARVGDLIAVGWQPSALHYRPREGAVKIHKGMHAGLSAAEMIVPLVLA
jgi:hypothetical protein